MTVIGHDPVIMLEAPIPATLKTGAPLRPSSSQWIASAEPGWRLPSGPPTRSRASYSAAATTAWSDRRRSRHSDGVYGVSAPPAMAERNYVGL